MLCGLFACSKQLGQLFMCCLWECFSRSEYQQFYFAVEMETLSKECRLMPYLLAVRCSLRCSSRLMSFKISFEISRIRSQKHEEKLPKLAGSWRGFDVVDRIYAVQKRLKCRESAECHHLRDSLHWRSQSTNTLIGKVGIYSRGTVESRTALLRPSVHHSKSSLSSMMRRALFGQ